MAAEWACTRLQTSSTAALQAVRCPAPSPADKLVLRCRAWKALLLTAYFNAQSDLWYELFSSWMGKGDKETFAYAFEATRSTYSVVPTPVGAVGAMGQVRT